MAIPLTQTLIAMQQPTLADMTRQAQQIAGSQMRLRAMPEDIRQRQALQEARIERERDLGIPGGRWAPGAAGIVQGLEYIKGQYGEDSPQYKKAQKFADIGAEAQQARGDYYKANLAFKNLPADQKQQLIQEMQKETGMTVGQVTDIASGRSPQISHKDQGQIIQTQHFPTNKEKNIAKEQIRQTEAILNKKAGSPAAQKAIPPLLDITRLINGIDIDPVSHYVGWQGKSLAALNSMKLGLGMDVPQSYRDYRTFVDVKAKILGDSIRQALATSVRSPYVKEMLMPLVDPTIWRSDPELAMEKFNFTRDWLNARLKLMNYLANKGIPVDEAELEQLLQVGTPTEKSTEKAAEIPDISAMTDEQLDAFIEGRHKQMGR